jgi:hypothetical protein
MKRYFFDVSDGWRDPDRVGTELPDDRAARREAIRFAGDILRHEPHRLEEARMRIDVHDRERTVAFVIEIRMQTFGASQAD